MHTCCGARFCTEASKFGTVDKKALLPALIASAGEMLATSHEHTTQRDSFKPALSSGSFIASLKLLLVSLKDSGVT